MAGYYEYSKKLGAPEDSYLYSSSAEMSPKSSYLGGAQMSEQMAEGGGAAASGAAGAAAMSNPAAAGIMAGGSFLSNYLAQKAADERARRANEMQNIQNYADNQNKGLDTLMTAWRGALR